MFRVFTALCADLVATHDPLAPIGRARNALPGTPVADGHEGAYPWYLLGADSLARDVFSRMVMGAHDVLKIAPAATPFAFMMGIVLDPPAGYFGGRWDGILSVPANLALAFPVILLFYLLVTPEIIETGLPRAVAAILFLFPILFLLVLVDSRFRRQKGRRDHYAALVLLIDFSAWSSASTSSPTDCARKASRTDHPHPILLSSLQKYPTGVRGCETPGPTPPLCTRRRRS
ncbi:hypothetical protein [Pseudogemmobacter sonorensis]|uniref:hypothetical protein n=1 Tax=Pseudogemmobacter sonorensis TaxID=2989681 RepID=UPI0036B9E361